MRLSPVTAFCDRHHDMYATILIAPSAQDSERIRLLLESDNSKRIESIKEKGYDPGRSQEIDWFQVQGWYFVPSKRVTLTSLF